MNRTSQTFVSGTYSGIPPTYEMLKEGHEVSVLGAPQSSAPMTTTVINMRSDTSAPNHIVWSLFNTLFTYWCCCLGFVAFAYSVKVGGCMGASPESVCQLARSPTQMALGVWEGLCVCVCGLRGLAVRERSEVAWGWLGKTVSP